jgi:hypothetical protein
MPKQFLLPLALVAAAIVLCIGVFMAIDTTPAEVPSEDVSAEIEVSEPDPLQALPPPPSDFPSDASTGGGSTYGGAITSRGEDGLLATKEAVAAAMAADTAMDSQAKEAVLSVIEDASTTYDVSGLTVLGPLLAHSDPDVREATVEGIVQLGDAAGAKTLRDAAKGTSDPKLKDRMLKAAQFLELPEYVPSKGKD